MGQGKTTGILIVEVGLDAGLRDLPVVGSYVPADVDLRVRGIEFVGATAPMTPASIAQVNKILAGLSSSDAPLLVPDELNKARALIGVRARLGGQDRVLVVSVGKKPPDPSPLEGDVASGTGTTTWFSVGQGLGPLRLDRLGVSYADGKVWLLADAELTVSALTLSGRGMGFGLDLSDPGRVSGTIDGLGLEWKRPPVVIAGALVSRPHGDYEVLIQGGALITTPVLMLSAVGGYARRKQHQPSLFVFGRLAFGEGKGIGPAFFRITGAAAGFGYNSAIRTPLLTEVDSFPLMPGASAPSEPLALLDTLTGGTRPWITETDNHVWVAGGIEFDSFKFITGSILAIGQFTTAGPARFSLLLLGRAAVDFPVSKKSATRYAHVELDVSASYDTTTDALEVFAAIGRGSFVVHPDCRLTGQGALCMWFGNSEHPGDFVMSLGGYHPHFQPPKHYPRLERLGLSWSVSDEVSVSGSCYGALTPSAFMVGGEVDIRYHASPFRASLSAGFDALVQWNPFHWEVGMHLDIGVGVDIWPYFDGHVSVSLDLWGPPTGGLATVHVLLWSFDVQFGEKRPTSPALVSWEEFTGHMLPEPKVRAVPTAGLLAGPDPEKAPKEGDPWTVSTDGFAFATQTVLPIQSIRLGRATTPPKNNTLADGDSLSARPVGVKDVRSEHRVVLTHTTSAATTVEIDLEQWNPEAPRVQIPDALWGEPADSAGSQPVLPSGEPPCRATGLRLTAPAPALSPVVAATTEDKLGNEPVQGHPVPITVGDHADPAPSQAPTIRDTIATGLPATRESRTALLMALAAQDALAGEASAYVVEDELRDYADQLFAHLREAPMSRAKEEA